MLRAILLTLALMTLVGSSRPNDDAQSGRLATLQIDHVILGVGDLDRGVAEFERLTGVRAALGGSHPGRGTHNALASLGDGRYLEILAPRPDAPSSEAVDRLRKLKTLTPAGWAVATNDPEGTARALTDAGYEVSARTPGSRVKADGTTLDWISFGITKPELEQAPFFISWNAKSRHPSIDAPTGCSLTTVTLALPEQSASRRFFERLTGLGVEVKTAAGAAMQLTLHCPKGTVRFGG